MLIEPLLACDEPAGLASGLGLSAPPDDRALQRLVQTPNRILKKTLVSNF